MKNNVQDLHKQYDKFDDIIKLNLVHQFDPKTKTWKFNGYQCRYCGSSMKYLSSIEKHPTLCKELNSTKTKHGTIDSDLIITTEGKKWNPLYEQYVKRSN